MRQVVCENFYFEANKQEVTNCQGHCTGSVNITTSFSIAQKLKHKSDLNNIIFLKILFDNKLYKQSKNSLISSKKIEDLNFLQGEQYLCCFGLNDKQRMILKFTWWNKQRRISRNILMDEHILELHQFPQWDYCCTKSIDSVVTQKQHLSEYPFKFLCYDDLTASVFALMSTKTSLN